MASSFSDRSSSEERFLDKKNSLVWVNSPPSILTKSHAYPKTTITPSAKGLLSTRRSRVCRDLCPLLALRRAPAGKQSPEMLPRELHRRSTWLSSRRSLDQCAAVNKYPARVDPAKRKSNPRWNAIGGQSGSYSSYEMPPLFDGERFLSSPVDIVFEKGLIVSVSDSSSSRASGWHCSRV